MDRKWWTRLVQTESTLRTNRVHHFRSVTLFDPRPSPDFSPRLRDKIWVGPGDEANVFQCATWAGRKFDVYVMELLHIYACKHLYTHTHTQDGFFPLFYATQEGHHGIVEMLLQAGATVDQQTKVEDCYYGSTLFICHL